MASFTDVGGAKTPNPDKALEVMKALEKIDGPMMKSKKFVAFILIQVTWKVLLGYGIYAGLSDMVLMAMVGAAGATETAFLGAQAWHDKHVKGAKATALNGSVTKALDVPAELPREGTEESSEED